MPQQNHGQLGLLVQIAWRDQQVAQAVLAAGFRRLAEAKENVGNARAEPCLLEHGQRGDGLHQRLAGAARLRDGHETRRAARQLFQEGVEGDRIEIVHEMDARRFAQDADTGDGVACQLRQSLAAEARTAGAEDHDVTCAFLQTAGRLADQIEIVGLLRQAKQRQRAIFVARAQPGQRIGGARERSIESAAYSTTTTTSPRR